MELKIDSMLKKDEKIHQIWKFRHFRPNFLPKNQPFWNRNCHERCTLSWSKSVLKTVTLLMSDDGTENRFSMFLKEEENFRGINF